MKLLSAEVVNFRSIKLAQINFTPPCLALVGINEAGKSNILKALSSLGKYMPTKDDIREPLQNENAVTKSSVEFRFSLTDAEARSLSEPAQKTIWQKKNRTCAVWKEGLYDLDAFIRRRGAGLYQVNLITQKKYAQYWAIEKDWRLADGWSKPSEICPADFMSADGNTVRRAKLIYKSDYPDIPDQYLKPADIQDLASAVGLVITEYIKGNLPNVVSWQYSESNLLPSSISINDFKNDPKSCVPLMNMFRLAGLQDISKEIESVMGESRNRIDNFFARVATSTTEHFRDVWKEHKGVSFTLRPDGEALIPGVREENVFNFAQRSDGFKRFVSFLLMVSAEVRNGDLENCLLLVDEPDISLHPSGVRFLLDELIDISKSNVVIFSTHSVFMVDREKIERHLIVKKKDERTEVVVANDENMFSEEVILNAMGSSVFEVLHERNIVFEGWKDKKLFVVATSRFPAGFAQKNAFKSVGLCYGRGVKNIKGITPLLELAQRKCLILTDGDPPSKEKQKEHIDDRGYGLWLRYDELVPAAPADITGEDFVKLSAFLPKLEEVRAKYPSLPKFQDDPNKLTGRLKIIDRWLASAGIEKDARKLEIASIKDHVFDDLKVSDVERAYYDLLSELASKLEGL